MITWEEVTARKKHTCLCCGGEIAKGETHVVAKAWGENRMFPIVERFCSHCGPFIREGCSFREARIKAFGSPLLRGWRRPK